MLGVIVGTGLNQLVDFNVSAAAVVETPYGQTSGELINTVIEGQEVVFLPRHGKSHSVPPHLINYRANIWALKQAGVDHILAFAAVGGIGEEMAPGVLSLPDQIIDYTYGREQTFFKEDFSAEQHIDFTQPYSASLREAVLTAAKTEAIQLQSGGVYACTQGPRLESAAEIRKLKRDGCDLVGMTAMPEAALARELEIHYATLAIVVNWGAGLSNDLITMASIKAIAHQAETKLLSIVKQLSIQL